VVDDPQVVRQLSGSSWLATAPAQDDPAGVCPIRCGYRRSRVIVPLMTSLVEGVWGAGVGIGSLSMAGWWVPAPR
jgi:hypothetical protein